MQHTATIYIKRLAAIAALWLCMAIPSSHATHIIGGDITYRYLGRDQFEILLVVRRDCFLGSDEAEFDDPVSVGVYDQNGFLLANLPGIGNSILIDFDATDTLNNRVVSDCGFEGEQVCVEETAYRRIVQLPQRAGGYYLGYNRCCRNGSIANILDPLTTGASFYTRLEESIWTIRNSSPTFNSWPEVYICADEPITFNSGATDPDGDSLVYELFTPFTGGTFDRPKPQPATRLQFEPVQHRPPFSLTNLLGGPDPLRIDPNTGQLSGTPPITGQFLVGVRVTEYRDGVAIGSTNRDFQYNVRVCSPPPLAQFANPELTCDGLTVTFENNSISASEYQWQFDFPSNDPSTASTVENPTFTFPAQGFYDVQLIATRGTDECADTSVTRIGVFETDLFAAFDLELSSCNGDSNLVTAISTSMEPDTAQMIDGYEYTFIQGGDTIVSLEPNPTFAVENGQFSVSLVVSSTGGCTQDTTVLSSLDQLLPDVMGTWTIESCLIADSTFTIGLLDTGTYVGTVQSIDWVVVNGSQSITVSGPNPEVTLTYQSQDVIIIEQIVTLSNGCSSSRSFMIDPTTDIVSVVWESEPITLCAGDQVPLVSNPNSAWEYTWSPIEGLSFVSTTDQSDPTFVGMMSQVYYVTVTDGECDYTDSIVVEVIDDLEVDVTGIATDCDGGILLTGTGGGNPNLYQWSTTASFMDTLFVGNPFATTVTDPEIVFYLRYGLDSCVTDVDSISADDVLAIADYTVTAEECPTEGEVTLVFADASGTNSPGFTPISWSWIIGEVGNTSAFVRESVTLTVPKDSSIVVSLTVTYANGCTSMVSDTIVPGPFATISFDTEVYQICSGDSIRIVNNPNPGFTYTWNPSDGLLFENLPDQSNPLFVGNTTTTYSVTVSDGLCEVDTTVTVELVDLIDVEILGSAGVCDSDVELIATGALGSGGVYEWSLDSDFGTILFTGDTLRTTLPGSQTLYYLRYSNQDCSSDVDSVLIETKDIQLDWIEPFPICQGDETNWLFFNGDTTQQLTFTWVDDVHIIAGGDTGTPTISVGPNETESFDLIFSVVNEFGCSLTDTITFIIDQRPLLDFDFVTDSCGGTTICFDILDSIDYNGFAIWDFGDDDVITGQGLGDSTCYTFPAVGTYTISVWSVSASCASDTIMKDITVYPLIEVDTIAPVIVCSEDTHTIMPTSNIEGTVYEYCTMAGVPLGAGPSIDIIVVSDSIIMVKGIAPDGCSDTTLAEIVLNIFDPVVDIPEQVCTGQDTTIMIMSASGNNYSYAWGPEECIVSGADTDNPRIRVTSTKVLSVTITDNTTGCMEVFDYSVDITSFDIDVDADPDTEINRGETVEIFVVDGNDDWLYEWSNGSSEGSQEVMPDSTTTYTVIVTNEDGCIDTASITITVIQPLCDENDVFIPNAFTPNGDNVNDVLFVRSNFVESMELVIYNRWGQEVFYSNDQSQGWDGTYGGNTLAPDAFAYALSVVCIGGELTYNTKGNVSLLK